MLKAIIFDYNGVLVDDLKLHEEAYWRAGQDLGVPLTRRTVRRYLSYSPEQKRKLYYGNISDEAWEHVCRLRERIYFDLARKEDVVFPGVEAVLTFLSGRYMLALISNTTREYFSRLFPPKLASLFRETLFVDEINKPKPSPDPLLKVIERLGVSADECCYVGDSLLDIQMAKRVDIKVFSVATGDDTQEELCAAGADWVGNNLRLFNTLEAACSKAFRRLILRVTPTFGGLDIKKSDFEQKLPPLSRAKLRSFLGKFGIFSLISLY